MVGKEYVSIHCRLLAISRQCNICINTAEARSPRNAGEVGEQEQIEMLTTELQEQALHPIFISTSQDSNHPRLISPRIYNCLQNPVCIRISAAKNAYHKPMPRFVLWQSYSEARRIILIQVVLGQSFENHWLKKNVQTGGQKCTKSA